MVTSDQDSHSFPHKNLYPCVVHSSHPCHNYNLHYYYHHHKCYHQGYPGCMCILSRLYLDAILTKANIPSTRLHHLKANHKTREKKKMYDFLYGIIGFPVEYSILTPATGVFPFLHLTLHLSPGFALLQIFLGTTLAVFTKGGQNPFVAHVWNVSFHRPSLPHFTT